jgi:tricorn protease
MFKKFLGLSAFALIAATLPAYAEPSGEAPRWLRFASIAPDGETIAFTHRGQIFVVPSDGGLAVPITSNGIYSHGAVWSPDSESLAFASTLNGSEDIYLTDFSGTLTRMSWSERNEVPTSFSADGNSILFSTSGLGDAERSVQFALSRKSQLYAVDIETGRERLVLPNYAPEALWNRSMDKLVYTFDPAGDSEVRQHRVAANARQLYIFDPTTGKHVRVFDVDGKDRHDPVWSADGSTLYYLSEASGTLNVWRHEIGSTTETQLTSFTGTPVRDLSIADDGTLAFINDGRIYVIARGNETAQAIEVMTLDQRASLDQNVRIATADQFVSSPDGKHFAMTKLGNVFLLDAEGNYRQVTTTPEEERDVAFAPDGSALIYASQRDHVWGLYGVELATGDDLMTVPLDEKVLHIPENGSAYQPQFSPDGSKIAFVANKREVQVLDPETGVVTVLFDREDYNSSYGYGDQWFDWSPTSEDLLVLWRSTSGAGLARAAIVPADGSARPQPISTYVPDFSAGFWSVDGSQVIGHTTLYADRTAQLHAVGADLYQIFISEEARQDFLDLAEGDVAQDDIAPKRYEVDTLPSERLSGRLQDGVSYVYPTQDGKSLVTVTLSGETTYLISTVDLISGQSQVIQSLDVNEVQHVSHVAASNVIDFKSTNGVVRVPVFQPDQVQRVPVTMFSTYNPDKQRYAAFEQVWADLREWFYSPAFEGRDWETIGAKYRAYLPSIATDREFADLIENMFGELSASHLFSHGATPEETQAGLGTHNDVLGVYLDYGYEGAGRRIAAILPGGPLDRKGLDIGPGDVIASINGSAVPEAGGISRLLDLNLQKSVVLGVTDSDGSNQRFVPVRPIDVWTENTLAAQRWRDARREMVDRLSNGCVAYQYVAHMMPDDYLGVLGTFSGTTKAKAALVDIRSNGGGNLTRELITLLTGEPYGIVGREDGPWTVDPDNRWTGPSAVLVDSYSYSDASIFPQAYQDAGIGPLVGDEILNTGTYRNQFTSRILPGYNYYIPVLPVRRLDGTYYENRTIEPDIHVPFDPNNAGIGVDPQLEAAVAALMEQIGTDSDCRLLH